MQKITVMGFIGKDPEERMTATGVRMITFSLAAVNRKKEPPVWYRCVSFGEDLQRIFPYIKKGSGVIVQGDLEPPKIYEGKDGARVNLSIRLQSIEFLPSKRENDPESVRESSHGNLPF